jgi:hypothetical protein
LTDVTVVARASEPPRAASAASIFTSLPAAQSATTISAPSRVIETSCGRS